MRFTTAALAGIILGNAFLTVPLKAQAGGNHPWIYRVEIFGDFGLGEFVNGVQKDRDARDFGGGVGWRPFKGSGRGLGFEARTAHMAFHQTSNPPYYEHLNSWLAAGDALYHFRSGARVQPYLLVGLGRIWASASKLSTFGYYLDPVTGSKTPQITREAERGSDAVFLAGGGLKGAVARHVSIRGEILIVRALTTTYQANTNRGPWGWFRATVGASFTF
jgi:hypothetical protein